MKHRHPDPSGLLSRIRQRLAYRREARRLYAGWRRPRHFDRNLVVIGAGSAGLSCAYIAAALKAQVSLIERERMGGDCLNTGCVPSKALIRTGRFLEQARRARELGLDRADVSFDFAAVMERVQRVIARVEPHDSAQRYAGLGVDVIRGSARLVSPWAVEVDSDGGTRTLTGRAIVLATGARPLVPPLPGLADSGFLTSETIWSLRERPARLLVLGGGPVGCELAQSFARLGSQVTLVEMGERLLAREDTDASEQVAARLRDEGLDLRLGYEAAACRAENGQHVLVCRDRANNDAEVVLPFDRILVAPGRAPDTRDLGLDRLGIPLTDTGTIETNDYLQTCYPNIYACGDVAGPFQFTHTASHQAWYATVNALFGHLHRFRADYSVIPRVTFTDPEVASVGLGETEARKRGIAYELTRYPIADLDRAIADGEAHGLVKVLTAPGRDRILGATIVGAHAGELIAEFTLAMRQGVGLEKILATVHAYPTFAESVRYAAGAWKRAHAPQRLLRWLERMHRWRL